jgi:hypothetical protein
MVAPICDTKCGTQPGAAGGGGLFSATKVETSAPFVPGAVGVTGTVIPLDSVVFDVGPAIRPSGGGLLIEQDGFYQVEANEVWSGTDALFFLFLLVNGETVQPSSAPANSPISGISETLSLKASTVSVLLQLSAGDVLQLSAASPGDAGAVVNATLSAEKVG